ncbi:MULTISPECIES: P-type DNA transfer protein VirB5 [Snodgrassella]|uniref:P-type DNA transfer protein VirB5 n=1 Tax=Snodgrassella TaxID=1193515 RepID=UPI0008161B00|nr:MULTISPECIES: P-type DNA transfer protein VirB5 [Snodgrassella]MCO6521227.1 P-type DNA transfer protein VirB5 [Snodgrassella sp.]SCC04292.1 type IV secretion system protein VirB5 [Snodgrassella sp. R-53583]
MKLKKTLSAVVVSAILCAGAPLANATGIPVFDGAAAANMVQQLIQMQEQVSNQMKQLQQLKDQYSAVTGSRNLGTIMNNPMLKKYLPNDWQKVYSNMKNGKGGMSSSARVLAEADGLFEPCKKISFVAQKNACENQMGQIAQNKSNLMKALDATESRLNQVEQLMAQINKTKDPKAIAELQARISAENAQIQNMATHMQIYDRIAAQQEKIANQQFRHAMGQRIKDDRNKSYY